MTTIRSKSTGFFPSGFFESQMAKAAKAKEDAMDKAIYSVIKSGRMTKYFQHITVKTLATFMRVLEKNGHGSDSVLMFSDQEGNQVEPILLLQLEDDCVNLIPQQTRCNHH